MAALAKQLLCESVKRFEREDARSDWATSYRAGTQILPSDEYADRHGFERRPQTMRAELDRRINQIRDDAATRRAARFCQ